MGQRHILRGNGQATALLGKSQRVVADETRELESSWIQAEVSLARDGVLGEVATEDGTVSGRCRHSNGDGRIGHRVARDVLNLNHRLNGESLAVDEARSRRLHGKLGGRTKGQRHARIARDGRWAGDGSAQVARAN